MLEQQLESKHVQAELALLRALRNLRAEHQVVIQHGSDTMNEERKQMSAWIQNVKDSCDKEALGGTYWCALKKESTCS